MLVNIVAVVQVVVSDQLMFCLYDANLLTKLWAADIVHFGL